MKSRMTVSVPRELADAAGELARRGGRPRSAVVEEALRLLLRKRRDEGVDASLDAYFAGSSEAERAEEEAMVNAFRRSQRRIDLDHRPAPRRRAPRPR